MKIELSIERALLRIVWFKTATHAVFFSVLRAIRKDILVIGMKLKDIVKFLLISVGVGFGKFIQFENNFCFF